MRSGLSHDTQQYLKDRMPQSKTMDSRQIIDQYVAELDEIIRTVCAELQDEISTQGAYEISQYNQTYRGHAPTVRYEIVPDPDYPTATLTIKIDPQQDQTIEFSSDLSDIDNNQTIAIRKSSSYKRYFTETVKNGKLVISTKFSKRQLYSRHLGGYIAHLLSQLRPFVDCLQQQSQRKVAA